MNRDKFDTAIGPFVCGFGFGTLVWFLNSIQ